ncbi:sensor domain-containing diguanylate cyclase [archaeon]|jgi:diguanylate cyclase (GGDEF)-like protein|nr:sensor domain-containing diguanylate cyclase [archaeon]MBT6868941.1 sensor domain-containing diguanylate cyclase [archaeon]MBT7192838.1 sensor domain-containing diguanylate cyclase [archaeon]MBT7380804.1 sensor domain-containing diguanylate cyclase [archaeon]
MVTSLIDKYRISEKFHEMGHLVVSLDDLLKEIVKSVRDDLIIPNLMESSVLLRNRDRTLTFQAVSNDMGNDLLIGQSTKGQGIAEKVLNEGKSYVANNAQNDPYFDKSFDKFVGYQTNSMLCTPLKYQNTILGVIECVNKVGGFTNCDIEKLEIFSDYAARQIYTAINVREQGSKDPLLTNLYNRKAIQDRFKEEMCRADKNGKALGFIILDLDNFKLVNDTYGHLAGDYVLKTSSRLIEKSLRFIDSVGRWGGEEIAVVTPGLPFANPTSGIEIAGNRIVSTIRDYDFRYKNGGTNGGIRIKQTISGGGAIYLPNSGVDAENLIEIADQKMYQAKREGRDRFYY